MYKGELHCHLCNNLIKDDDHKYMEFIEIVITDFENIVCWECLKKLLKRYLR